MVVGLPTLAAVANANLLFAIKRDAQILSWGVVLQAPQGKYEELLPDL